MHLCPLLPNKVTVSFPRPFFLILAYLVSATHPTFRIQEVSRISEGTVIHCKSSLLGARGSTAEPRDLRSLPPGASCLHSFPWFIPTGLWFHQLYIWIISLSWTLPFHCTKELHLWWVCLWHFFLPSTQSNKTSFNEYLSPEILLYLEYWTMGPVILLATNRKYY